MPVEAHVLAEIEQLQAGANGVGVAQVRFNGLAEQMQQQPAYRIGRAAAVILQVGVIGVPGLDDVLRERIEQVAKQIQWQPVLANRGAEALPRQIAPGFSGRGRVELPPIAVQRGEPPGGRMFPFVGEIVGAAREPVDGLDRLAQRLWQQHRGDREVFVVGDGHGEGEVVRVRPDRVAEGSYNSELRARGRWGCRAARRSGTVPAAVVTRRKWRNW